MVEAASFMDPKLVPQMAGVEEVMAVIERRPGTSYAGLVLNEKGYERAIEAGSMRCVTRSLIVGGGAGRPAKV